MKLSADGAGVVTANGDDALAGRLGVPVHGQGEVAKIRAGPCEVAIGTCFVEALIAGDDDGALEPFSEAMQGCPELPAQLGISVGGTVEEFIQTIDHQAVRLFFLNGLANTLDQINIDGAAL